MNKRVVMVIDDSSAIRQALKDILTESGFYVIEARHGAAGLDYLDGRKVNLVLLDLNMPEMDGYEFLKKIKNETKYAMYKNTPVIILTTETDKTNKEKTKELGAYGWISKPFNPKTILDVVEQHCLKE